MTIRWTDPQIVLAISRSGTLTGAAKSLGIDHSTVFRRLRSLQDSLAKSLDDLPLPARAINALKNDGLLVVADLVQKTDADLERVKNLGDKSIDEIKTALAVLGLSLGMRIDPNLLGTLGRGGAK